MGFVSYQVVKYGLAVAHKSDRKVRRSADSEYDESAEADHSSIGLKEQKKVPPFSLQPKF